MTASPYVEKESIIVSIGALLRYVSDEYLANIVEPDNSLAKEAIKRERERREREGKTK
jgi:hypothetical protein